MSGAQGSRTAISFSTNPGEGYNLMRQVLVRMVLATQQAGSLRRSWSPDSSGELGLALAPICPTPHVSAGGHPAEGLPWSRLIDLEHLAEGIGMPVVDLETFVAEHPAAPWRLIQLRTSPRILAMLPGSPPDCWERRDAEPEAIGCRCRPKDWLRWSSVQAIDAFFSPESDFLAREILSLPDHDAAGIFLSHAETMYWGRVCDSAAYWRVIAALRPAEGIRDLAARHRPAEPYLAVHWRRGDFRRVHAEHSPSPKVAAEQIASHARKHALRTVFVATDAGEDEIAQLRAGLEAAGLKLVTLQPESVPGLCDLERAALEQAILFHGNVFVGTRVSTFSHTVFETREASQAWEPEATWNVLCGDDRAFDPVEPRREFKPGAVRKGRIAGVGSVNFVSGDSLGSGAWTILPILSALAADLDPGVEWVFFSPEALAADPQEIAGWLAKHDGGFVGRAIRDLQPTGIHHYRQDPLAYPDLRCGFALSRSLVLRLAEAWRTRTPSAGFHIDAAYELAAAVLERGIALTDEQRFTPVIPLSFSANPVSVEDVVFAVKTHGGNHGLRIPVLQRTWGSDAQHMVFYSDVDDPAIPTVSVDVPNSPRGHGQKFHAIARHLLDHHGEREWFVIADDDTLLSVPRLLQLLGSFSARREEPLFIGQRYGYGHGLSEGGYDFITMGGGMAINRRGLQALLDAYKEPPAFDTPDDMWLGRCMMEMGIEAVHHDGFHQEPPSAYPPELISGNQAVSFHRHAPDDPDAVYARYLAP
jgi:UDP-glucose:O-linked fucose beta-1,3-glucosyltransferase